MIKIRTQNTKKVLVFGIFFPMNHKQLNRRLDAEDTVILANDCKIKIWDRFLIAGSWPFQG